MKPYSKNIIFIDTEFTDLDSTNGEIISIGLVKLDGQELYLELEYTGKTSAWVKKNVLPHLGNIKVSKKEAISRIRKFVGKNKPYALGFVPHFDTIFINKLFGIDKHPFKYMFLDFASILFSHKINPEIFLKKSYLKNIGINLNNYKLHNALDDARLLREAYLKFINN